MDILHAADRKVQHDRAAATFRDLSTTEHNQHYLGNTAGPDSPVRLKAGELLPELHARKVARQWLSHA